MGKLKTMNKTTRSNMITYAMVIIAFVLVQILIGSGSISQPLNRTVGANLRLYCDGHFLKSDRRRLG